MGMNIFLDRIHQVEYLLIIMYFIQFILISTLGSFFVTQKVVLILISLCSFLSVLCLRNNKLLKAFKIFSEGINLVGLFILICNVFVSQVGVKNCENCVEMTVGWIIV